MFLKPLELVFALIFIFDLFTFSVAVADSYRDSISGGDQNLERQTGKGCKIPDYPLHTTYNVIDNIKTNYEPGDNVANYAILQIFCDNDYDINGLETNISICVNGNWTPKPAHCARTCSSLTSVTSTNVTCRFSKEGIDNIPLKNCNNPVEGTIALVSCNPLYEEANLQINPMRVCRSGNWVFHIPQCYPTCGQKRIKRVNHIGTIDDQGDYPWHAGIYNIQKELLCEGTIIDQRVILSAANCFTDRDGNVLPAEEFLIAAGKYYDKYDDGGDTFVQYSNVLKIYVPERYKGNLALYSFNIAAVVLADPFTLTPSVQPVCLELNENFQKIRFSSNSNGVISGWSSTQERPEDGKELQEDIIQYIPYTKCFSDAPINFRQYITADKICGSRINQDTSGCAGYSGAGLFFKNEFDRYYLKGIVDLASTDDTSCGLNKIRLYTSISHHINFIREILVRYQMSESLESP